MFPTIEPFKSGLLPLEQGHSIYWELSGNPAGKPAIFLHGGPGAGNLRGFRKMFDPEKFLIIYFDQRGCGQSRPLVNTYQDLSGNNTQALINDIEALRSYLGVEKWIVTGGSWGSTLGLAYSQAHPERVTGIVLSLISTTSEDEVSWITEGVGRLFPSQWEKFAAAVRNFDGDRLIDRYYSAITSRDPEIRRLAARAWCEWENAHVSLDPNRKAFPIDDDTWNLRFASFVIHYWRNSGFLSDQPILQNMGVLAEIPGFLIHGQLDVSSPMRVSWELQQKWPKCQLIVVPDEGHGGPKISEEMCKALSVLAGQ